jgi:hypothetical protein
MPPDLTSLFDVLFIVIFAALIRAAAVQQAAEAKPAPPPPAPAIALDPATLRARAVAAVASDLTTRPQIVVRISTESAVTTIEVDGQPVMPIDTPLLERSNNPDVGVTYLGDRIPDLHVCKIVALHLRADELARYLVIIAPARRLADLPHALYDGLHRDVDRCLAEQHGLAVLVDPAP